MIKSAIMTTGWLIGSTLASDIVVQISSIRTADKLDTTKSPPRKTFNLVLTCTFDSGELAFISLWEKHARQINEEIGLLKGVPIVAIVTVVNPKSAGSQLYLNGTASTRFFYNMDNMIVKDFCESSYYHKSLVPTTVDGNVETIPKETHTIAEILDSDKDEKGFVITSLAKMFWCKAKVVDLILSSGWFFRACYECRKKLTLSGSKLFCPDCDADKTVARLLYRIEVIADDGHQTGSFVIFNDAGLKLCNTSASELAAKKDVREDDNSGDSVPQIIRDIVGKDFIFYMKESWYKSYQSFSVSDIYIPPTVNKKRPQTSESSTRKKPNNTIIGKKVVSECSDSKKQQSNRKNKKVVVDESDEEASTDPRSGHELDDEE